MKNSRLARFIIIAACLLASDFAFAGVLLWNPLTKSSAEYVCSPLNVNSGVNNAGVSINGYLNDVYTWYDAKCQARSAALARNDTAKGGNAKQFTYVPVVGDTLPAGGSLTINPGASAGGFGYVVAHLANASFANANGKDDSPLGSGNSATYAKLFAGSNHALHQYTLNYIRYGLTASATAAYLAYYANGGTGTPPFMPWDYISAPNKNVTVYNMPVTIQWLFATGRNYPLWTVTFDLSQAPNYAVQSDFRAPYGDMKVEGGSGAEVVGGVGWGDEYQFVSMGTPFTMNNAWDYSHFNNFAPFDYLWTANSGAEMGLAGTQLLARQNAGGYNNGSWSSGTYKNGKTNNNLRSSTSAKMGACNNDGGAGAAYTHTMPCMSDWAYQLMQYSLPTATATTSDKRLAWGADWGSLGYGSLTTVNGTTASGWPKVSYSVYVVLDNHANTPTLNMAEQAEVVSYTSLTAAVGSVLTSGPAGVGRSDTMSYSPVGYNPVYGTWEVNAVASKATISFNVNSNAPTTLNSPVIVVHNYTKNGLPLALNYDGKPLVINQDYFLSQWPAKSELWITLVKNLSGSHTLQIQN